MFFAIKTLISGLIIAIISEVAKKNPRWAALLTALPLMTILSLFWIYFESRNLEQLYHYTKDVLIWILPSFLFLFVAIFMFKRQYPFWISMSCALISLGVGVYLFQKMKLL